MSTILKILAGILLLPSTVWAQIGFHDASARLPRSNTFYSWLQKGACDMNNDRLDDIVRASRDGDFYLLIQPKAPDTLFTEVALGNQLPAPPLSIILGDVNNDDYPDILTGANRTGIKILKSNVAATVSGSLLNGGDTIFTQASALADINGDGWLDAFVCHDDAASAIWRNTGQGNFVNDNMGIDLKTVPASDNSGNYGIVFTDFDNDGDQDFYISKCRAGVTDPADPRRINQLFVNDGNYHYTENAAAYNLKDDNQSWVTDFQDIDNDGDLDAFIANHYTPSRLLENDGTGHFTDITTAAGLGGLPNGILQALLRDFDNDGYMDLLVSGMMDAKLMKNNGNNTFSDVAHPLLEPISGVKGRSFIVGDFNTDGFLDLYVSYHFGNTDPDRLWLNTTNTNHFLPVYLFGYQSNRNAVGARITLEAGGQKYTREVRAGESYGISNTHCQIIGVGSQTVIDKLTVRWPDGKKNVFTNVKVDTPIFVVEGKK